MYEVILYEDSGGKCPANDFLDSLPPKVEAKVYKWIVKLEEHGPNLPRPFADKLKGEIRELRIVFASNHYRVLYFFHGKKIIITHGFIKKSSKVPQQEIQKAERFMGDFRKRVKRGEIKL